MQVLMEMIGSTNESPKSVQQQHQWQILHRVQVAGSSRYLSLSIDCGLFRSIGYIHYPL